VAFKNSQPVALLKTAIMGETAVQKDDWGKGNAKMPDVQCPVSSVKYPL